MAMYRPALDRVLVKREVALGQTPGGLFIPGNAKEKLNTGVISAVGPGRRMDSGEYIPAEVSAGDKIIFGPHAGEDIMLEEEEYVLMREDDILCVVED